MGTYTLKLNITCGIGFHSKHVFFSSARFCLAFDVLAWHVLIIDATPVIRRAISAQAAL